MVSSEWQAFPALETDVINFREIFQQSYHQRLREFRFTSEYRSSREYRFWHVFYISFNNMFYYRMRACQLKYFEYSSFESETLDTKKTPSEVLTYYTDGCL